LWRDAIPLRGASGTPSGRGYATKRSTDATYDLTYDAENRLTQIQKNGAVSGTYVYDGDGNRVEETAGSVTTVTRYVGPHYEVTLAVSSGQVLTTTKYYNFGGQRLAVRQNGALSYLHGDQLGSTSVTTNNIGAATNNVRHFAYDSQRSGNLLALPTDHTFTGGCVSFSGRGAHRE
jgi:YD repeat-containing protein